MTEHPNYKYRPRRRKHTKSRTTGANSSASGSQPGQNNLTNHPSPDMPFVDGGAGVERMSPYSSNYTHMYYGSTNALHTPEPSPTHSPEPTQNATGMRNRKLNTLNGGSRSKHSDDASTTPSLPTPEMSPLELEKENYSQSMTNDKQKMAFMEYNGHIKSEKPHQSPLPPTNYGHNTSNASSNNYDQEPPEHHIIKREYTNYSSNNSNLPDSKPYAQNHRTSYLYDGSSVGMSTSNSNHLDKRNFVSTSSSPLSSALSSSTTIATGKGMYVTCSSRGILDQGNVVRGTYFPPLATTQDHQNLGTVTPSLTVSAAPMSGMNYTTNHHHQQPQQHHLDHHQSHLSNSSHNNASSGNSNNNNNNNSLNKDNNNHIITETTATSQNGIVLENNYVTSGGPFGTITVTAPIPTYASSSYVQQYKDYVNYEQTNSTTTPPTSSHVIPQMIDVDSREFDKYLKYHDTNHNFNDFDASNYHTHNNSIYHHQVTPNTVHILSSPAHHHQHLSHQDYYHLYHQNSNTAIGTGIPVSNNAGTTIAKVDAIIGAPVPGQGTNLTTTATAAASVYPASVLGTEVYVQPDSLKEDDFSNILAGVRKTCYSN